MKTLTFTETYTPMMIELLKAMIERESGRLSAVLQTGTHHEIAYNKYAIEDLSKAKMIISTYEQIKD